MTKIIALLIIPILAFAQASKIPADQVKIGIPANSGDKGIVFDTNDGVSNKKLTVEKTSKKLKYDGNTFQLGDGNAASDKSITIGGANKSLKYDGTNSQFDFDDDVKVTGEVKTSTIRSNGTEVAVESDLRAKSQLYIGTATNSIRVNAGNLEFTNDGSLYKKIGSGSGGGETGVNLLQNSSLEDGIDNLTNSGGTLTQESYTNGTEGDLKYARFVSTASGQYVDTDLLTITDNLGAGGMSDLLYATTATTYKWQALTSTGTVIAEVTLPSTESATNFKKLSPITYVNPLPGQQIKGRVLSAGAGTINFDKVYVGSNKNISYVQNSRKIGQIQIVGCSTFNTTSPTFTGLSGLTGCSYTVSGEVEAPTAGNLGLRLRNKGAGEYVFQMTGMTPYVNASGAECAIRGVLGTDVGFQENVTSGTSGDASQNNFVSISKASPIIDDQFIFQMRRVSGSGTCQAYASGNYPFTIDVYYYPNQSDVAYTPEQAEWLIDANIGGANISAASITTSYLAWENANLDLVINSNKGSAPAKIACSGTNPSTGLTCAAGVEQVGITFTNKLTGLHEVCFQGTVYAAGGTPIVTTQWVETALNSQTIIQEGGSRPNFSGASGVNSPLTNCGTFTFSEIKERTLRFMYETTSTAATLIGDRDASVGQRDIKITVRPITQQASRPILLPKQKFQKKFLSGNVSTSGVLTDLTFNNLVVGKAYRVTFHADFQGTTEKRIDIKNGATSLTRAHMSAGVSELNTDIVQTFIATSPTLTFDFVTASSQLQGGSADSTHAILEEMFDYELTGQY